MADNIKFALVLTESLNRKLFQMPQAIVEISVDGLEA
jgi:hypothetical protein